MMTRYHFTVEQYNVLKHEWSHTPLQCRVPSKKATNHVSLTQIVLSFRFSAAYNATICSAVSCLLLSTPRLTSISFLLNVNKYRQ